MVANLPGVLDAQPHDSAADARPRLPESLVALLRPDSGPARVEFVVIGGVAGAAHGSVHVTNDLDICYSNSSENLERLAGLLQEWEAYPRGVERGLPFIMDVKTIRVCPELTLSTSEGDFDVFDEVAGVGGYPAVRNAAEEFEAYDTRFPVLGLEALLRAKRATGRRKDLLQLPELEALAALRKRTER